MTKQQSSSKTALRTGKTHTGPLAVQAAVQNLNTTNPTSSSEIEAMLFAPENDAPSKAPKPR